MIYFTIDGANTPIEGTTGISPDIQPPILSQRVKTPEKPSVVSWKFTHACIYKCKKNNDNKVCFFNNLLILLNHQMICLYYTWHQLFLLFHILIFYCKTFYPKWN